MRFAAEASFDQLVGLVVAAFRNAAGASHVPFLAATLVLQLLRGRPPYPGRCKAAALSVWSLSRTFSTFISLIAQRRARPSVCPAAAQPLDPATRRLCQAAAALAALCERAPGAASTATDIASLAETGTGFAAALEVLAGIAHELALASRAGAPGLGARFRPHRALALSAVARGAQAARPDPAVYRCLEAWAECPTAERCAGICGDSDATAPNATVCDAGAPDAAAPSVLAVRAALASLAADRGAAPRLRWSARRLSPRPPPSRSRCAPEARSSKAAQIV